MVTKRRKFLPIKERIRARERDRNVIDLGDYTRIGVLKLIFNKLKELYDMSTETQAAIDEMRAQVERLPTVIEGVKKIITDMAAQIEEAADDPAEGKALAADLRSQVDTLAAAVVEVPPMASDGQPDPEVPEPSTDPNA